MKSADVFSPETTFDNIFSGLIPLNEVPRRLPRRNGKFLHISTVFRWMSRGCNGIYLEHWRIGRALYTTDTALLQFFTDLAKVDSAQSERQYAPRKRKRRPRPAQRKAAQAEAEAILRKAKILV